MRVLLLMRTRGLLGNVVQNTNIKPATVQKPAGVKSAGPKIYKDTHP